jgi:hypothetical protein
MSGYTVNSGAAFKDKKHKGGPLIATPYTWRDPKTISPRDFLYGYDIVRGYVSGLVSMGGVGKTSEIQVEIAAMVTGRNLLGVKPKRAYRVWYINLEDPLEEIDRRMAAIFKHYGITERDIGDRFFRDSGRSIEPGKEGRFIVARESKSGNIEFVQEAIDDMRATVRKNDIDYVVVDPFVNCARFAENDNNKMAHIIDVAFAGLAEHEKCATGIVHHVRKGSAGHSGGYTVEDTRGASALVNSCRTVRILNTMTKDEGEKAGVERHRSYFRIDNGKTNIALPPDESEWRKIISVDLDNKTDESPADRVGVVTLWKWPDPLANLTVHDLRKVQETISKGGPWRKDIQATDWVGKPISETLKLDLDSKADKERVKAQIKIWLKRGALKEYEDEDKNRNKRTFVKVGTWAETGATVVRMAPGKHAAKPPHRETTASVPFMITAAMKDELKQRGFTDDDVFDMKPEHAHAIIADPNRNADTERFKVVGEIGKNDTCVKCGKPDGVRPLKDSRVGGRAVPLHLRCAREWFDSKDLPPPDDEQSATP